MAPLRYDAEPAGSSQAADDPFRTSPPAVPAAAPFPDIAFASFVLDNGLRVVVVERHRFPTVAARLVIDTGALGGTAAGALLAHLLGNMFLAPPAINTTGACSVNGCNIASHGTSDKLSEVLARIAGMSTVARAGSAELERRRKLAEVYFDKGLSPLSCNAKVLLFGEDYGCMPSPGDSHPSLDALERLHADLFIPANATLVVVGDVTKPAVQVAAVEHFGAWRATAPAHVSRYTPPPPPEGPRSVFVRNPEIGQVWAMVAARGPAPDDPDDPAVRVLVEILGGRLDSVLFHHVREEMGAAYQIGASIEAYPEGSMIGVTGSFDPERVTAGIRALLDAVGAARDLNFVAEDVDRAKRAVIARYRQATLTNNGVAQLVAHAVLQGMPPERVLGQPARVEAVTTSDLRAVAQRYLDGRMLRLVLLGKPEASALAQAVAFGEPATRDPFGRLPDAPVRLPHARAGDSWSECPFPPESEKAKVDEASVDVRIAVGPSGAPGAATVLLDPGYGFADAARRCVLAHTYAPALTADGRPTAGTMTLRVHFARPGPR